jgi:FixJ family two-component response regulator
VPVLGLRALQHSTSLETNEFRTVVGGAIERSLTALREEAETQVLRSCCASLTPREHQVMALVVSGLLNKQVGGELGISEITVKAHRGQVMRKMKAGSLPVLLRMASKLAARTPTV